jgi:hypothetical protein
VADVPTAEGGKKPTVGAKLRVQEASQGEKRPRTSFLKTWYEQRGQYDVVHVTNLGTIRSVWSGRLYDGKACLCMAPKICTMGPACTNPDGGDTRAYAAPHNCQPILTISEYSWGTSVIQHLAHDGRTWFRSVSRPPHHHY